MPTGTANTNKAAPPEVIAARPAGHCVYLAAALIPSCCPCGVRYTPASMVSYNAMFVNVVMIIFHHWAINRTMPSGPRGESGHVGDCGTVGTPGFNGSTVPGAAGEGPPSHGALPVLLRPEARQCRHGGPRMVGLSAAFPVPRCRACGRCTRAWLPVAPGAHCTVWPCCVVTGPPVVGAPNAPRAPANEPANKPGGGARGAAGLRVRRRPGRCGLPRDPWAVVPKRPERSAEHRQTIVVAAAAVSPGAQVSTGAGRPRGPPTGGGRTSRLPCSGCPAGREPERTPPRTKAAGKSDSLMSFAFYCPFNRRPLFCCWSAPAYCKLVPTLAA